MRPPSWFGAPAATNKHPQFPQVFTLCNSAIGAGVLSLPFACAWRGLACAEHTHRVLVLVTHPTHTVPSAFCTEAQWSVTESTRAARTTLNPACLPYGCSRTLRPSRRSIIGAFSASTDCCMLCVIVYATKSMASENAWLSLPSAHVKGRRRVQVFKQCMCRKPVCVANHDGLDGLKQPCGSVSSACISHAKVLVFSF